jgi:site-specific DNA recombinase
MTAAAIYVRVSSAGQEQDGTNLDTQEAACRAYAHQHGCSVADAHVFREVYSGADLHERPRLGELRRAAREGEVQAVICYAVDRLSRNQAHLYIIAEEFEQAG